MHKHELIVQRKRQAAEDKTDDQDESWYLDTVYHRIGLAQRYENISIEVEITEWIRIKRIELEIELEAEDKKMFANDIKYSNPDSAERLYDSVNFE